ncbi:MAG: Flp pilus assembly protein TadB [Xanthobacteraceae bacterium]|jgi:tight adherence protein B|nr:Flp pilus assembly protein TadB [Xanthobacteraceae bacterium]
MFPIDSIYVIYLFVAVSAGLFAEAMYLLFYKSGSYRRRINHRLNVMADKTDRGSTLAELRRERGLTSSGNYRLPLVALNRLVLQSGVTIGFTKLILIAAAVTGLSFLALLLVRGNVLQALLVALVVGLLLPYFALTMLRNKRQKAFGAQFPDALDIIVRSLRAGHPVPIAINMVGREMPDPIGSEFGIISDEITYGADLETALRNLHFRIGQEDLPLFVTAVAIQGSTGGNLGEILDNLSNVIRQRFKMRRKVRALASEGRASAMILSSLPIGMFLVILFISPDFYSSVWSYPLTKMALGGAAAWMGLGNLVMFRMVNFRI